MSACLSDPDSDLSAHVTSCPLVRNLIAETKMPNIFDLVSYQTAAHHQLLQHPTICRAQESLLVVSSFLGPVTNNLLNLWVVGHHEGLVPATHLPLDADHPSGEGLQIYQVRNQHRRAQQQEECKRLALTLQ